MAEWYKNKDKPDMVQTVMFVDPTPGGKLVKSLRAVEEKFKVADNKRIKFVERSGTKLSNLLEKKDPFEENCSSMKCGPCRYVEKSGVKRLTNCRRTNVTYRYVCVNCQAGGKLRAYDGESA